MSSHPGTLNCSCGFFAQKDKNKSFSIIEFLLTVNYGNNGCIIMVIQRQQLIDRIIVQHIIDWVEDNIENPIRIDDVAEMIGYCRRNVQLIFKRYMHSTLGEYIRKRRMARAAALIKISELSLMDISVRLNFDSQQSFTREFKKILGVTPLKYKKNEGWYLPYIPSAYIFEGDISCSFCKLAETEYVVPRLPKGHLQNVNNYPVRDMSTRDGGRFLSQFHISDHEMDTVSYDGKYVVMRENGNARYYGRTFISPAGKYAKIIYKGPRENLTYLPRHFYLSVLPTYRVAHLDSCDIVEFSGFVENKKDIVECIFYMPVTDI